MTTSPRDSSTHQHEKSWQITLLLSAFLGPLGIDRFYLGKVGTGILKLLTVGGFGIWWLTDVILVAAYDVRDSKGYPLQRSRPTKMVGFIAVDPLDFKWRRAIAVLEIIGGLLGAAMTTFFGLILILRNPFLILIFAIFFGLFLFSVFAGVRLWQNHRRGILWSKLIHALQVPYVVTDVFTYQFASGISLTPILSSGGISFESTILTGSFNVAFFLDVQTSIGVNLFALAVLIYLVTVSSKIR